MLLPATANAIREIADQRAIWGVQYLGNSLPVPNYGALLLGMASIAFGAVGAYQKSQDRRKVQEITTRYPIYITEEEFKGEKGSGIRSILVNRLGDVGHPWKEEGENLSINFRLPEIVARSGPRKPPSWVADAAAWCGLGAAATWLIGSGFGAVVLVGVGLHIFFEEKSRRCTAKRVKTLADNLGASSSPQEWLKLVNEAFPEREAYLPEVLTLRSELDRELNRSKTPRKSHDELMASARFALYREAQSYGSA